MKGFKVEIKSLKNVQWIKEVLEKGTTKYGHYSVVGKVVTLIPFDDALGNKFITLLKQSDIKYKML